MASLGFQHRTQVFSALNTLMVVGFAVKDYFYSNISGTYGRYTDAVVSKDGKFHCRPNQPIEAKLAWFLMEAPNLLVGSIFIYFAYVNNSGSPLGWMITLLFMMHYIIRTLVYSTFLRGSKPMPIKIVFMGALFTTVNGSVQTYHHLFEFEQVEPVSELEAKLLYLRVAVGFSLFLGGFLANQWSDAVLRALRKEGDTGYYIPRGFFFDYVSAPNLIGEIVEWLGYGILANSFVSYCFFISTTFNVGSRAIGHHKWYLQKFEDYPKQRKALIPFVY